MSKRELRTLEGLYDAIFEETSWRKQEMAALVTSLKSSRGVLEKTLLRGSVALLYAHWEGWTKNASKLYLGHVRSKRLRFVDLSTPFLGGALKSELNRSIESSRAHTHNRVAEIILGGMGERASIPDELIQTESNLSSNVFEDILTRLGLDAKFFSTKHQVIDVQLVAARNMIAHGEYLELSTQGYLDLHEQVVSLLEAFTTAVLAAAADKAYLASASAQD